MSRKGRRIWILNLILLIIAAAALGKYMHERNAKSIVPEPEPETVKITEEKTVETEKASRKPSVLQADYTDDTDDQLQGFLERAGFEVARVTSAEGIDAREYDALVIPGGHNVTPELYGEERSEFTSGTNLEKDEFQIALVKAFAESEKPILGVCRGCQLVNVAFGGTIDQGNGEYHKNMNDVYIDSSSWLYPVYGDTLNAFHFHKQQIRDVAPGFRVTMISEYDGKEIIEGIEHETLPVYCVQWHPDSKEMYEEGLKTFIAFREIAEKNMQ